MGQAFGAAKSFLSNSLGKSATERNWGNLSYEQELSKTQPTKPNTPATRKYVQGLKKIVCDAMGSAFDQNSRIGIFDGEGHLVFFKVDYRTLKFRCVKSNM